MINSGQKTRINSTDESEDVFPNKLGYSFVQEVQTTITVHLNQPFMEPDYYDNIVDALSRAGENDVFIFKIASPGGYYSGLVSLLDAVESTEALVIADIVGEAHSAASIFALSCPQVRVGPYAEMLAHSARYGFTGKSADNVSHVLHTAKVTDKVMRKAYEGFLTEQEINEVTSGKELYLDADEITSRLEKREQYFEEKFLAEQEKLKEADLPVVGKARKRKVED